MLIMGDNFVIPDRLGALQALFATCNLIDHPACNYYKIVGVDFFSHRKALLVNGFTSGTTIHLILPESS